MYRKMYNVDILCIVQCTYIHMYFSLPPPSSENNSVLLLLPSRFVVLYCLYNLCKLFAVAVRNEMTRTTTTTTQRRRRRRQQRQRIGDIWPSLDHETSSYARSISLIYEYTELIANKNGTFFNSTNCDTIWGISKTI